MYAAGRLQYLLIFLVAANSAAASADLADALIQESASVAATVTAQVNASQSLSLCRSFSPRSSTPVSLYKPPL